MLHASRFTLPMAPTLLTLVCTLLSQVAVAQEAFDKYPFKLAPPADLNSQIKARPNGFNVDGEARLKWSHGEGKYRVTSETRAMLVGKILDTKSEGVIDDFGLAPLNSTEKRFRKETGSTTFDRDGMRIRFSASGQSYPIKGGEQDRNSAIWQLIAVARAAPAKFKAGSEWKFFVAGQKDAEAWIFRVTRKEKISTPHGELDTVRIEKKPPQDHQDQQVDIWLAPGLEWYPARIRYTDPDGDYIEQNLASVTARE